VNPEPEERFESPLRRAEDLLRGGRPEEARQLLEGLPGTSVRVLLARLAMRRGDLDGAHDLYAQALAQDPGNLAALRSLASSAVRAGRNQEARELLDRWAALDPLDPELEDLTGQLVDESGLEAASPALRPLPVGQDLEELVTRPETSVSPPSAFQEGELMPAPALADPDLWDLGDEESPGAPAKEP